MEGALTPFDIGTAMDRFMEENELFPFIREDPGLRDSSDNSVKLIDGQETTFNGSTAVTTTNGLPVLAATINSIAATMADVHSQATTTKGGPVMTTMSLSGTITSGLPATINNYHDLHTRSLTNTLSATTASGRSVAINTINTHNALDTVPLTNKLPAIETNGHPAAFDKYAPYIPPLLQLAHLPPRDPRYMNYAVAETHFDSTRNLVSETGLILQPFQFLNLPAEIRVKIYRLVLIERKNKGRIVISQHRHTVNAIPYLDPRLTASPTTLYHNILYCNRQTFSEGVPIVYSENTFHIDETADIFFTVQLPRLESDNAEHIRKIVLADAFFYRKTLCHHRALAKGLQKLSGLQELRLERRDRMWTQRTEIRDGAIMFLSTLAKLTQLTMAVEMGLAERKRRSHLLWKDAEESMTGLNMRLVSDKGPVKVDDPWEKLLDLKQELAAIEARKKAQA